MKLLKVISNAQPRPPKRPSILASNDVCPCCGAEFAADGEYTIRYDGIDCHPYRVHPDCDDTMQFFELELGSLAVLL